MTANNSIDPALFLAEHINRAEPDLLRSMLTRFVEALMGAEADAVCGAPYGSRSEERVNSRALALKDRVGVATVVPCSTESIRLRSTSAFAHTRSMPCSTPVD